MSMLRGTNSDRTGKLLARSAWMGRDGGRRMMVWRRCVAVTLLSLLLMACSVQAEGLLRPNGVAVAPDGSLYVMDRGNYRVVHLSSQGRFLDAFGQLGTQPQAIHTGWDIALDSSGNIYICNQVYAEDSADLIADSVKVFAPDGSLLRELGHQVYTQRTTFLPNAPVGLDIDDQDRVYVADATANTVRIFNPDGTLIARFFGEAGRASAQFNSIVDVAVDDQRSLMYVADSVNSRIQQFHLHVTATDEVSVTYRLSFGSYGWRRGELAYPSNLTVDERSGHVYVSDMANRRIQVFNAEGAYVNEFAAPIPPENVLRGGIGPWQVLGLALGPDGAIYAADALNNVIWVFEPDGQVRQRIEVQS